MSSDTLTSAIDIIAGMLALIGGLAFLYLIWVVCRSLSRIEDMLEELIHLQRRNSTTARH